MEERMMWGGAENKVFRDEDIKDKVSVCTLVSPRMVMWQDLDRDGVSEPANNFAGCIPDFSVDGGNKKAVRNV